MADATSEMEKSTEPYIRAFLSESGLMGIPSDKRYVPDSRGMANHLVEDYLVEKDPHRKLQFQYYPGTWFDAVFRSFFSIKYSAFLALSADEKRALKTYGLVPMIINMGQTDDGMEKKPGNVRPGYAGDDSGIEVCCLSADYRNPEEWDKLARHIANVETLVVRYMASLMPV